jgi:hypothetical protein
VQVDVVAAKVQPVTAGGLQDEVGTDAAPQPRHQGLQRVGLIGGRLVTPQRVDQRLRRDRSRDVEGQPDQQPAQPRARQLDLAVVVADGERPEKRDLHVPTIAAGLDRVDKVVSDH